MKNNNRIDRPAIEFLRAFMDTGITPQRLEHSFTGYNSNIALAAMHATMRRMRMSGFGEGTPSTDHFVPILLGWKLEATKKEWCGCPQYAVTNGNFPWSSMTNMYQPASDPAQCSVILWKEPCDRTFGQAIEEVTYYGFKAKDFEKVPARPEVDPCFSLGHALRILKGLFVEIGHATVRRAGLLGENDFLPGQALIIPVRFTDYSRATLPTSVGEPNQGIIVARQTKKMMRFDENTNGAMDLEFIPGRKAMDYRVHQSGLFCVRNLQWEKRRV